MQFYGNPLPTSLSRLSYSEHDANDFRNASIERQEAIIYPEMLDQSRKSEIEVWREYGVYQEVENSVPETVDVKKAVPQSENMERDVYVEPPIEADMPNEIVFGLSKTAYGLGDAAREWYKKLDRTLKLLGLTPSRNEPALYYMRRNHQVKGILVTHVDDSLYAGDSDFERAIGRLDQYIQIGKKAQKTFKFCGFSICTCNNSDIHIGVPQRYWLQQEEDECLKVKTKRQGRRSAHSNGMQRSQGPT